MGWGGGVAELAVALAGLYDHHSPFQFLDTGLCSHVHPPCCTGEF